MTKKIKKAESEKVLHLTSKNWKAEVLEAKVPVVVDFGATWCGPCQDFAPLISALAEERDDLKVGKVDIDDEDELTDEYDVQSVPTLLVFTDGKVIGQSVGSMPKKELLNFLDRAIKGQRPGLPKVKKAKA